MTLAATDLYLPARSGGSYVGWGPYSGLVTLTDCQVYGGSSSFVVGGESYANWQFRNNLFWRTILYFSDYDETEEEYEGYWGAASVSLYNNLFYRGGVALGHGHWESEWTVRDNAFDGASIAANGDNSIINSHNGYINASVLPDSSGDDVPLTTFIYQNGPRRSFYQQSTDLRDQGSRSAADAGLDSYTTQANQTPDSGAVDIGYHYWIGGPPTAIDGSAHPCRNQPVDITLSGFDPDGDLLSYILVNQPIHGTLTPTTGASEHRIYTPAQGYEGPDSFTFKVNDGHFDSAPATVTLEVGYQPVADPLSGLETCRGRVRAIMLTGSDGCDQPSTLTFSKVTDPDPIQGSLGAITPINATSASVTFTPNPLFCDEANFTFKVNDGFQDSTPATVSITVGKKPSADPATLQTCKNATLNFAVTGSDPCNQPLEFVVVSEPDHKQSFSLSPNGSVSYTPAQDYCGPDSFEFKVTNGCQDSDPATVSITVGKKPSASSVTVWTCKNTPLDFTLTGSDPCNATPVFELVPDTGPEHYQTFSFSPNGSVSYTPAVDYVGQDSFKFKVLGDCEDSDPATVTIQVDQPPVAFCQEVMVKKDESITFHLIGQGGEPLRFDPVPDTGPEHDQAFNLSPDGQVSYTPDNGYEGTDGFDFTVTSCGQVASAHVTIYVTPGPTLTADCRPRSILLTWDMAAVEQLFSSGFADAGFKVYRSTSTGGPYTLLTPTPLNSDTRTYADTSVTPNTAYFYVVTFLHTAYNCDGSQPIYESPFSNEVGPISTCCPPSNGPFWTDYGGTAQELAEWIVGPGLTVQNATYTGAAVAKGTFGNGSEADLPINTGVILSSGDIAFAKGPNDSSGTTGFNFTAGDSDLNDLVGFQTADAAVLEFDIISVTATNVVFDYVFASEEYLEFVGSEFDDPVAIFVDGSNIARVPSTADRVSVNTVNPSANSQFYRNNPSPPSTSPFNLEYDGLTTMFRGEAQISALVLHHVKIAIADSSDLRLDSAVFIRAEVPCP